MSNSTARPVVVSIPAGAITKDIPLNRHADRTTIGVAITGANTYSIDSTLDTVLWDTVALKAVNLQPRTGDVVDTGSANWVEELASGSVTASLTLNAPVAAIRIVKSGGAGTAEVRIQQT